MKFNAYKKIVGAYFFIGGIVFSFIIIKNLGLLGILYSLIPAAVTLMVQLFFIITGFLTIKNTNTESYINLIVISFLIQAIHLGLMGLSFKNYFGPLISFGFTDTPEFKFVFQLKAFDFLFANGFNKESNEVSLSINLFPLILLLILLRLKNRYLPIKADSLSF